MANTVMLDVKTKAGKASAKLAQFADRLDGAPNLRYFDNTDA
jgi:hypothetical protein